MGRSESIMATGDHKKQFEEDGYVVIENFITAEEADAMRAECYKLVDEMDPSQHHTVFSTTKQSYRDNYFLNSADKIGYFFEDGALDGEGKLQVDKQRCLNKIGHALHVECPSFRKVCYGENMKKLGKVFGYADPVIVQSMYIFKQPGIGGQVTPHQDGTFIYTDPLKAMGVWIALEDATLENGCLWFTPGSHKGGLRENRRFVRNPEAGGSSCVFTGGEFDYDGPGVEWKAAPIKKGDLIVIDALVFHKSERNTSDKSRHIFT